VPGWSKELKTSFSPINARAETVTQKPAFRKLLSSRRCLVPAIGYFEWAAASADAGRLVGLLRPYRPYPNDKISAYRVGRDVNSPSNDRAEVIEAV
jgi:putative SOS response-associated peptidase YedK